MTRGTRRPVGEKLKIQALETLARGRALDTRQREALRELGIEARDPSRATREREWTEGAKTLLWRLLNRGWSVTAIAAFCLRTPEAVAAEVVRSGWQDTFPKAFTCLRSRRRPARGNRTPRRGIPA